MKIANVQSAHYNKTTAKQVEKSTRNFRQSSYCEFSKNVSNAIKNNALSLINFKGNDVQKIDTITAKLKKEYGIEAEFKSLAIAKMTLESIEDFVKLNNKNMFEGLVIKPCEEDVDWIWDVKSDYSNKEFILRLNNNVSEEEIIQRAQKEYDNCNESSNNPKHDFYVALAEFLSFKYNPYAYVINTKNNNYSPAFLKTARKISDTSTYNFARFNSNYIAAKMCGLSFPELVDKHYNRNTSLNLKFPS